MDLNSPNAETTTEQLREKMAYCTENFWGEVRAWGWESFQVAFLQKLYGECSALLSERMGPDAHCADVDPWTWETFWDLWKDEHGFRPREMHFTRAECLAFNKKSEVVKDANGNWVKLEGAA